MRVQLEFGVDATKLHVHFKKERFHRIYFNFPYTSARVTPDEPSDTARMLLDFFRSAAQIQEEDDRILLTLVYKPDDYYREYWHGHVYGIAIACREGGYQLIQKRRFAKPGTAPRYPGYTHRDTNRSGSSDYAKNARQYVFKCVKNSERGDEPKNPAWKGS